MGLVDKLARARSDGFHAWIEAKGASDWQRFLPALRTLRDLTLERARAIDPHRHPYEVLLEEYDPGTTVESLRAMFARLRDGLVPLIEAIAGAHEKFDRRAIHYGHRYRSGFWAIYLLSAIAVLFAWRRAPEFRDYIDSTVVFGTPVDVNAWGASSTPKPVRSFWCPKPVVPGSGLHWNLASS